VRCTEEPEPGSQVGRIPGRAALALFSMLAGYSLMRRSADQLVRLALETKLIETGAKKQSYRHDC
jgi:hypothetical protein